MFHRRAIHIVLLAAALLAAAPACSVKFRLWRANRSYQRGAYSKAIDDYRYAAARVAREQQPSINLRLANAYYLIGNTRLAETTYERAIPRGATAADSTYLALAMAQLSNEKFPQALANFNRYIENTSDTSASLLFLRNYCHQMTDTAAIRQTRYVVSNAKEFNSAKDDFAPAYISGDYTALAFTSTREESKGRRRSIITGDKNADLYSIAQMRGGKWEKAMPMKGKINNKNDNGVCSFSADYQTIYFTECIAGGRHTGCKLYSAVYDPDLKEWNEVTQIVVQDSALTNFAHPAISADGTELYFAADCDSCDGYGGFDIYKMQRATGSDGEDAWSMPQNMGPQINTAGDETYPYLHPGGALYFASTGHSGFGGMDIFRAQQQDDRTWKVENMGLPINSSADDFSIIFEADREAGLFASRRRGGRGGDDIYRFILPEMKYSFAGIVKLKETSKPMPEVTINMLSNTGDQLQLITDPDGKFAFNIKPETDYLLQVRKKGYFNEKLRFTTIGMEDEVTTIREEFFMTAMDKAIELEDIFYEFGKWELLPESEESLNNLAAILSDNPAINIVITAHTDMRGSQEVNQSISQKRAQSVVDYLTQHGIAAERLQAEGMGKSSPRIVSPAIAQRHSFLREGDILSEEFSQQYINSQHQQEIIDQLNRRTEFVVVEGGGG